MAIDDLIVTENYAALQILRQVQLNTAMTSIETWVNTRAKLNLIQIGLDVFGNTYSYNNDGLATRLTPLIDSAAILDENETVGGSWTFTNPISFQSNVGVSGVVSSTGQPRCKVFINTANQTIANNLNTPLNFTGETYDVGSLHDSGLNPNRITIPGGGGGIYVIKAQVTWVANVTGRRDILIYKNGIEIARHAYLTNSATIKTTCQISVDDNAAATDFYECFVYQDSGAGLDVEFGSAKTFLSVIKVW